MTFKVTWKVAISNNEYNPPRFHISAGVSQKFFNFWHYLFLNYKNIIIPQYNKDALYSEISLFWKSLMVCPMNCSSLMFRAVKNLFFDHCWCNFCPSEEQISLSKDLFYLYFHDSLYFRRVQVKSKYLNFFFKSQFKYIVIHLDSFSPPASCPLLLKLSPFGIFLCFISYFLLI